MLVFWNLAYLKMSRKFIHLKADSSAGFSCSELCKNSLVLGYLQLIPNPVHMGSLSLLLRHPRWRLTSFLCLWACWLNSYVQWYNTLSPLPLISFTLVPHLCSCWDMFYLSSFYIAVYYSGAWIYQILFTQSPFRDNFGCCHFLAVSNNLAGSMGFYVDTRFHFSFVDM